MQPLAVAEKVSDSIAYDRRGLTALCHLGHYALIK
jgi:hypothetical protein